MEEVEFAKYLRKKRKKNNVIERNVKELINFEKFLLEKNKNLSNILHEDIKLYISKIEGEKKSAKGPLYVLMNYFKFCENNELYSYTKKLREERTKKTRSIFLIKDFVGIDQKYAKILAKKGIKNVNQMLEAGCNKQNREKLSLQLNIPEDTLLEFVKLSDITRIGYVKSKLARLYYNAGIDSPTKIAEFKPKELHEFFKKFVKESNWNGMVPNLADLVNNIRNAKKLESIVQL